jgi:predicted ester cyclase
MKTIEEYTAWTKGLFTPIPDANTEVKFLAEDAERSTVAAYAIFKGTQTGPGGPGEPTGKSVATDYVYVMEFEGEKIKHMTKIWNDVYALRDLGWGS